MYCSKCNILKSKESFYKTGKVCIECKLLYQKDRYSKIKDDPNYIEKQKRTKAVYYQKNKDRLNSSHSKYYESNKAKYKEYRKQYVRPIRKRRRNPSISDKIRSNISRSISKMIVANNGKKNDSIINYLSFTFKQLKSHLESQFEPWMNWSNYGKYDSTIHVDSDVSTWKWQIDHIIPHSRFKYCSMDSEEFRQCWALTNLRPLNAKQNITEGNRRDI